MTDLTQQTPSPGANEDKRAKELKLPTRQELADSIRETADEHRETCDQYADVQEKRRLGMTPSDYELEQVAPVENGEVVCEE